jgi:pyridoxal phosphate enzyme (YggS family)
VEEIEGALRAGVTDIGENRVQEADNKFNQAKEVLPKLTKRLVGHLQSNKTKKALQLFDTIDSVDSIKLANKIGKCPDVKVIPVLLEVNTSGESAKFGFDPLNIDDMLQCLEVDGIDVQGLMTIGPLTKDKQAIRGAFIKLRDLLDQINSQRQNKKLSELSMGMSGDFEIAVEEGATMVRLGTALFGARRIH